MNPLAQNAPAHMSSSTALWYQAKQKLTLRTELLHPATERDVHVEALYSGVSRGTERLVFQGKIPDSEWGRMSCPHQEGQFPFPVKYGYGFVGRIVDAGASLSGQRVFCLHPHQSRANVSRDTLYDVPGDVPSRRAVLAANMETALNVVWDSGASAGDRVLVVGAGVVGMLLAWLLGQIPGTDVVVCEIDEGKRVVAGSLGLAAVTPSEVPLDCDITINASASEAGLRTALAAAGFEGRIVEASWFGDQGVTLPLGAAFHSRRLQIVSSQVGHVSRDRRARWSYRRRMEKAISLLSAPALDNLITHEIDFMTAPDELPPLFDDPTALCVALRYPEPSSSDS